MANIKKYNPETQNWETWASSSASGVYSVNPTLLPDEEQVTSVEDALVRDREDIEAMKKNISWLALHGGGGSGGGGGDYMDVTSTIDILDQNHNPTNEIIWKTGSKSVAYQITSSKASNKFTVTATLDGYTIYSESGVAQTMRSININKIGAYSSSTRHVLRISAVDSWDNVTTAQAVINETAIKLNKAVNTYTVNIDEITRGSVLSINYQSSIIGDYILYWGNSSDLDINSDHRVGWKEISIRSAFAEDVVIPYWASEQRNRLLTSNDVRSGQTLTFYFVLISVTDSSIKSDVLEVKSTVVSPREIAIQPITLSAELSEATNISKMSIMNCNFIAYLNSTSLTYDYTITANKLELNDSELGYDVVAAKVLIDNGFGRYGTVSTVTINSLPKDDFFEGGNIYRFDIYVRDRMDITKYNTTYSYVNIQSASNSSIPLGVDYRKVFDFNVWGDRGPNEQTWVWSNSNEEFNHSGENKNVTTTMTFNNMGGKSKLESTHCRLTNKAYAVINKSTINGEPISWFPTDTTSSLSGLVPAQSPQFTLSISYHNDFTPDDDRTIFNFGNYVPATTTTPGYGRGILINNHDFYVKIGPNSPLITGKIQDSIYHEIDIVFGRGNVSADSNVIVEVYHNGVLLAINKRVNAADVFGLSQFDEMSIACYKQASNLTQFTNIKLQSVAFYAIALNPYQIVCNWINHLVTYELDGNTLNTALLNKKLGENLITAKDDGTYECAIWDIQSGEFSTQNWITINNGQLSPDGRLHQICPIPIVILDLSTNSNWNWDRFTQSWASTQQLPAENVPMYFYKAFGGETVLNSIPVTVEGQGTTSKAYAIKNLNIDFGENRLFWAKQNWFPERIYTLKADVVDSAHVNNACIGKFVNTCAQNTTLLGETPPMRYFNENKSEFDLPESAVGEDGVSIKHTLEGFPVLLLARFPKSDGTTINKSLGIYSFNLGRESYYNMGFKVLKRFKDTNDQPLGETAIAPMLLGRPDESLDVIDFNAQSWEGKDSFNCTPKREQTESEINAASNGGYDTSVNATMPVQLDGYFWSSYPNHIKHFWENKYPGGANIADFQALCRDLVECPYTKGSSNIEVGAASVYQYDWDGTKMFVPDQTTNATTIKRLNKDTPPFNIPNARFYYVISMLFGLVDSLGKNLNMRLWKNTHLQNVDPIWYTCFYDMDTAMGIDNAGAECVRPDVLDEELYNDPELIRKFAYGTYGNEKMYTVRDNKLWGILDHPTFKDQYGASGGVGGGEASKESLYASVWNFIRTNYLKSADDFMEKYFDNQTEGVGELLYNQDFDVKYVSTPQSTYMYGDRKAFVKDWITKRIKFLDSYFGYLQRSGSEPYLEDVTINDCSYKNIIKIKHQSGTEYVPVVTNAPCIITTTIGGQTTNYYYVPANTPTDIRVANSVGTAGIQTQINNSDLLLEIRNMPELSVQAFEPAETRNIDTGGEYVDDLYSKQYGSLSSFTKFNVSGNKTFENGGIDFIKLFKTWNNGEDTLPYTLTELNLSNTKNNNVTSFQLNLKDDRVGLNGASYYRNPFENLTDINIVNSCVTDVTLPEDIALNTLQIAGSAIENVILNGQSILKTIDFSNCIALNEVSLNNCAAFETLNLAGTPLLNRVSVTKCPVLHTMSINMNGCDGAIRIFVDEVPGLKHLTISNVRNTGSTISIIASGLEDLSLEGCEFSEIQLSSSCKNTLKSLDISNSLVKVINWDGTFNGDYLDLSECPSLVQGGINITNNTAIQKLQLPNIAGSPVNLNFSFSGCVNLERIYGNINVNRAAAFKDCKKFKIHGGTFDSKSVKLGNGKQLYLADAEISGECLADKFQEGSQVTNLVINIASPTELFRNTAVDAFDVYYVLRHLGSNVRNISSMFRECPNIKMKITSSTIDNSPHWTMFDKCGNIEDISYLFFNDDELGPFRLYGNHIDDGGHQGLFTPLVNCKNFTQVFGKDGHGSTWFIADLNTFKLDDNVYFGGSDTTITINHFRPRDVYDNLNDMTTAQVYLAYSSPNDSSLNTFTRGTLKGVFSGFKRLPSTLEYMFYSLRYLDFGSNIDADFSNTMDKIPLEVTSINNCFNAEDTSGNIILQRLFTRNPETNEFDVRYISNCFDGSSGATWQIDNNSLSGFTQLATFSSVFSGTSKIISGTDFPYNIFDPCKDTISNISGFFSYVTGLAQNVKIPGTLFTKCKNLTNISSCFSHFGMDFEPTANGFINCPKLSNVSNLFTYTNKSTKCIPNNFFNTGFIDNNVTIIGAGINEQFIDIPNTVYDQRPLGNEYLVATEENDTRVTRRYRNVEVVGNRIKCNPMSTYWEQVSIFNGSSWAIDSTSDYAPVFSYESWEPTSLVVLKHLPRKTITSMNTPFHESNLLRYRYYHPINLDPYTNGGDVEPNPDYCPFDYIYEEGTWSRCNRDDHEFTFMWAFDGAWDNDIKELDFTTYLLEDEIPYNVMNSENNASSLYGCPPDLLRWCTSRPDIGNLFSNSGFGGRIVPYLLKPVDNLSSISSMFYACSNITAYCLETSQNTYVTIPPTFFDYTPNLTELNNAFSHCVLYTNPDVFGGLKGYLNVAGIFYGVRWSGGTSSNKFQLSGVFASNKIVNCSSAFSGDYSDSTRNQYIQFNNMFSKDKTIHPESADNRVFYGYTSESYVTHEVDKTCSQIAAKKNYLFYGQ